MARLELSNPHLYHYKHDDMGDGPKQLQKAEIIESVEDGVNFYDLFLYQKVDGVLCKWFEVLGFDSLDEAKDMFAHDFGSKGEWRDCE